MWSGNGDLDGASQCAVSSDFVQGLAGREGTDAFISTHAHQGAVFAQPRALKADPPAPNPLLTGRAGVQRHVEIFATARRTSAQRVADGAWVSM